MDASSESLISMAQTLKILADPTRLRLFEVLLGGVYCNCELGRLTGLSNNLISHHLRVLTEAGLVHSRRDAEDARWIYFTVDRERTEELLDELGSFLRPHLLPREPDCSPRKPSCK